MFWKGFYIQKKILQGNVFFTSEYSNYARSYKSDIWYVYDDNYILPVKTYNKLTIIQGQFVSEPFCLKMTDNSLCLNEFIEKVLKLLNREGVAWITTSVASLFKVYPAVSQRIPFGSHIIDLSLSEDELLMNMHSKHRNSVRRAEKNGVVVKSGGIELIPDYLKADEDTWRRSGQKSHEQSFFNNIIQYLDGKACIYVSYKNDYPQAGACYFVNKEMCYYMYGASIDNPEPGATNYLQWIAIKDMKARGVKKFSFVGCRINEDEDSKYHGIQRFKERFGGKLEEGYMFRVILNSFKFNLFKKLYHIKNHKEYIELIDQEIHKWPELQK